MHNLFQKIDESGNTLLHQAAERANLGDKAALQWLLKIFAQNTPPTETLLLPNQKGNTPLHLLFKIGNNEINEYCIKACDKVFGNRDYLFIANFKNETPWEFLDKKGMEFLLTTDKENYLYKNSTPLHQLVTSAPKLAEKGLIKPYMLIRKDKKGHTPVVTAVKEKPRATKYLVALLASGYNQVIERAQREKCDTWLHDLIRHNYEADKCIQELIDKNIFPIQSLKSINSKGNTPLHVAAAHRNLDVIPLLIQLGSNVQALNLKNITPLQQAYKDRSFSTFKRICESDNNNTIKMSADVAWEAAYLVRDLYVVFGSKKLTDKLGILPEFQDGGSPECYSQPHLKEMLEQFIQGENDGLKSYQVILDILKDFKEGLPAADQDQIINDIFDGKPAFFTTGCLNHVTSALIERDGDALVLSIGDRGLFSSYNSVTKQVHAIESIRFPMDRDLLEKVIGLLRGARTSDETTARVILLFKIPDLVGSEFTQTDSKGNDLVSKHFKAGLCFWSNIKTMLHDLFIKQFGIKEGQLRYKKFDIFLHKKTLEKYCSLAAEEYLNKDLIRVCQDVIKEKEDKLANNISALSIAQEQIRMQNVPKMLGPTF